MRTCWAATWSSCRGMSFSAADNRTFNTLLHTIGDFERITDHAVNLTETAREIPRQRHPLQRRGAGRPRGAGSRRAGHPQPHGGRFPEPGTATPPPRSNRSSRSWTALVREVKARHIARLQAGTCTIEYGFVLDDLLTVYERIADHCSNIAVAMIEVAEDRFDTHEYLNRLRAGGGQVRAALRALPRAVHLCLTPAVNRAGRSRPFVRTSTTQRKKAPS